MRTMSYGASVLVIGCPPIDRLRVPSFLGWFHRDAVLGDQRRCMVAMSASFGTLRQDQPLIGQHAGGHQRQGGVLGAADARSRQCSGRPPRMRILIRSMEVAYAATSAAELTPRWRMYLPALSA